MVQVGVVVCVDVLECFLEVENVLLMLPHILSQYDLYEATIGEFLGRAEGVVRRGTEGVALREWVIVWNVLRIHHVLLN